MCGWSDKPNSVVQKHGRSSIWDVDYSTPRAALLHKSVDTALHKGKDLAVSFLSLNRTHPKGRRKLSPLTFLLAPLALQRTGVTRYHPACVTTCLCSDFPLCSRFLHYERPSGPAFYYYTTKLVGKRDAISSLPSLAIRLSCFRFKYKRYCFTRIKDIWICIGTHTSCNVDNGSVF